MQVTPSPAPSPAQPTAQQAKETLVDSDFETFLVMLTTQMQNQDPLNPIQSSDYAVQLATFSGVEQQVRGNQLLESLSSQMSLMGMAQLAGWVGMEARTSASAHFDGGSITLMPQPAASADTAKLVVRDERGVEVQRLDVPASATEYTWTGVTETGGTMLHGNYAFSVESYAHGELIAAAPVEAYGEIAEARSEGGQIYLLMKGGAKVESGAITALRAPQGA